MGVLLCLAEHAPQVVTREQFIAEVWNGRIVTDEVLSRAVSLLRSVLEDDAQAPRFVRTVPRVGYALIAPVEALTPAAPATAVWRHHRNASRGPCCRGRGPRSTCCRLVLPRCLPRAAGLAASRGIAVREHGRRRRQSRRRPDGGPDREPRTRAGHPRRGAELGAAVQERRRGPRRGCGRARRKPHPQRKRARNRRPPARQRASGGGRERHRDLGGIPTSAAPATCSPCRPTSRRRSQRP